jgi:hypothetical protein
VRFSGRLIRTNVPLPPASGPVRVRMLWREGRAALHESIRDYGSACRLVESYLGGRGLPTWRRTIADLQQLGITGMRPEQKHLLGVWSPVAQRAHAIAVRHRLGLKHTVLPMRGTYAEDLDERRYGRKLHGLSPVPEGRSTLEGPTDVPWERLESLARRSLARAVDAFNFLEDSDLADLAHGHAHEAAAFVSGVFGCVIAYDDGTWWDTCPLTLMHQRWGMSIGFTATRACSICHEDLDTCPHLLGTLYEVTVARTDEGQCSACGASRCRHEVGYNVTATPHPILTDGQIHEVSVVSRPRDPLARLTKIEKSVGQLARALGREPGGEEIACYRCLHPCNGFIHPFDRP